jgi:hypothetical protein
MRQVITAKDIQLYFGKKESMSFKMIRQIKKYFGKQKHQPITISEFCEYYRVDKESILVIIKGIEESNQNSILKNANAKLENSTNELNATPMSNQKREPYRFSKSPY